MESTIDDIPSELNLHFQYDFPAMRCHSWRPDSSIPPVCSLAAGMAGNLVGPSGFGLGTGLDLTTTLPEKTRNVKIMMVWDVE
jgi:hypothetical protein